MNTFVLHLKKRLHEFNFLTVISAFVTAFFVTGTVQLCRYDVLRNFYNINLVNLQEIDFFLKLFSISFIVIFLLFWLLFQKHLQNITALAWIIFLCVFSYFSPVKSLVIGALIIAVPSVFITISHSVETFKENQKKNDAIISIVFSSLVSLMFIAMIVLFIQKSKLIFTLPVTNNLSNISDDLIYAPHMVDRWKEVLIVFLITLSLFLIYSFVKPLRKIETFKINFSVIGYVIIAIILIVQVVYLSMIMSYRVKVLTASTYDFGIFLQMFYNMRAGNGMLTTLERSMVLSHLQVHFSPIFYLMLPVFMIFPYGETIQVLQILTVASGLIPLWLITKHLKINQFISFALMIIYIAFPALITSHLYDIHENCFLAPMILFVLYFALKKQTVPLLIFTLLTLFIKEDSAIYVFFIGLYLFSDGLFSKKSERNLKTVIHGLILSIVSVLYFLIVTKYLNESGDGAMFWRYMNLFPDNHSELFDILQGFLLDPSYYLATIFSPLKVNTILLLFGSVGMMPLFMKKYSGYFLIVPVVIINYLSTYPYQHQFGFQYFYGSSALVIFMAILAVRDLSEGNKPFQLKFMQILSLIGLSVSLVHGYHYIRENKGYMALYESNEVMYESMKSTLTAIPKDLNVVASGYLTPYLSDRYYVFDYDYFKYAEREVEIDYFIIDGRIEEDKLTRIIAKIHQYGYTESPLSTEYVLIFEPQA